MVFAGNVPANKLLFAATFLTNNLFLIFIFLYFIEVAGITLSLTHDSKNDPLYLFGAKTPLKIASEIQ